MKQWTEFDIRYSRVYNYVTVTMYKCTEGKYYPDRNRTGEYAFKVTPWWHSLSDIERKLYKAKSWLMKDFLKNNRYDTAVEEICHRNEVKAIISADEQGHLTSQAIG